MIQAIAKDRTPEWHAARKTGVGASEAAAVCGLSRWETALDVWARKTGRVDGKLATPVMELGTHLEPDLQAAVAREHEIREASPGLFRHPEIECVLASPDGVLADGRGLELKVTSERNADIGDGVDDLPTEWLAQAEQQMAVCGFSAVLFGVAVLPEGVREWLLDHLGPVGAAQAIGEGLRSGSVPLRFWTIDRNEKVIDGILNRDVEFWRHVESDTPPQVDWEHAKACQAVKAAFSSIRDEEFVTLDDEAAALWEQRREQKAIIKEAEKVCSRIDAEMFLRIQHAGGGVLPDGSKLKKIVVGDSVVPSYVRKGYTFFRQVKG